MSEPTSVFEPPDRRLERKAAESIDEDTDLLTVVPEFDFSTAEVYEADENEWNARCGYESMVRAFYCKELVGFKTEEHHKYLANVERALTLGFDPDQFAEGKTAPGDRISFETMFVPSNDLFLSLGEAGIPLFENGKSGGGDITSQVELWDAGTEQNQTGVGPAAKPNQPFAVTDVGPTENEPIHPISEIGARIEWEAQYVTV